MKREQSGGKSGGSLEILRSHWKKLRAMRAFSHAETQMKEEREKWKITFSFR